MFDIFGVNKIDAHGVVKEMMHGAIQGLLDSFEVRLLEKQMEIDRLNEKLKDQEIWKALYDELLTVIDYKKGDNKNESA